MRSNSSAYKDNVDSFGFSALYYWKLKPIEISKKSALETLGFKELYPNTYKIYHLKNHSYYSHSIDRAEIVFVFLGDDDDKGALDTDTVHKLFMSGFNVISVDARKENIMLSDVLNVVYRYSTKDIKLFFIIAPGTLINNMHAISILGHKEEITQPIDSIWKLFKYLDGRLPSKYIVDHINTASFIKGLSYAASGYSAEMSIFLIQSMPWIFPSWKEDECAFSICSRANCSISCKIRITRRI